MKCSYLLPLVLMSLVSAKNVVDLKERASLNKRDAKRVSSDQDLKISPEELSNLFPNPLKKRSGVIIEPNLQVIQGSVEEINENQRLFEQGVEIDLQNKADVNDKNDEVHIMGNDISTLTLGNVMNSNSQVSIFSSYARSLSKFDSILNDAHSNIIVMTPLDEAIISLPLKPWEFPYTIDEYNNEKDEISNKNIDTFIRSHIIESATEFDSIAENDGGVIMQTMNKVGVKLSKDSKGDFQITVQGYDDIIINVVDVKVVDNGVLLVVDHVLEWPGM